MLIVKFRKTIWTAIRKIKQKEIQSKKNRTLDKNIKKTLSRQGKSIQKQKRRKRRFYTFKKFVCVEARPSVAQTFLKLAAVEEESLQAFASWLTLEQTPQLNTAQKGDVTSPSNELLFAKFSLLVQEPKCVENCFVTFNTCATIYDVKV